MTRLLTAATLIFLAFCPLPLASGPPVFWAVSAIVVGLIGTSYFGTLAVRGMPVRLWEGRSWPAALMFAVLLAYLLLQAIPLPFPVSFGTFGGAGITAHSLSLAPGASLMMALRLATYAVFFVLIARCAVDRGRGLLMLYVILGLIVGYAALGLLMLNVFGDTMFGAPKTAYLGSATATFVNRNTFATFLAFGLVAGTGLLLRALADMARDRSYGAPLATSIALLLMLAVILTALLATHSRMGLFAGVAGCLFVFIVATFKTTRSLAIRLGAAVGIGVVVVVVIAFAAGGTLERLGSLESSSDIRLALYQQILQMIAARPWLGYGGGSFELAFPLFHHSPVSSDVVWDKAHNTYLAYWAELGVVFGSLPVLILLSLFARGLKTVAASGENWMMPLIGCGVIVVAAVHSTVDFSLEIPADAFYFTALIAIGTAATVPRSRRPADPDARELRLARADEPTPVE